MTLIETLIGFLILFFVMVSVLQIFSMAYAVNMASRARTDLTYRAQRTAEVIRTIYGFEARQPATFLSLRTNSGVDLAAQMNQTVKLPPSGTTGWWGKDWAGILVEANPPCDLSYEVSAGTNGARFTVTVIAAARTSGARYVGLLGPQSKVVRYAVTVE